MDKLHAMATFVRIVDAGSLTAAAAQTGSSLTSVVRSLASLEGHLGVRLINRTTRRLALTEEGRDYLFHCRKILAEIEDAESALSDKRQEPSGLLRLTAPVMFGRLHVAPVVTDFLAAHPAMRAELVLLDRVVDFLEEGLDLAIRIGPLADSSLVATTIGQTRRIICASPPYLAEAGEPTAPRDLVNHRCIGFSGNRPAAEWEFTMDGKSNRTRIDGRLLTNQVDVALGACLQGLGLGMFYEYQVAEHLRQGRLKAVLTSFETPQLPISILFPSTRQLSLRVRSFVDWAAPRLRARIAGALPSSL